MLLTAENQEDLLQHLVKTVGLLGFDYCSFVLRAPYPLTKQKRETVSNYPAAWQQQYVDNCYFAIDPIVQHCLRSMLPVIWCGEQSPSSFWEEALAQGIRHGWAQRYCNQ